MKKNWKLWKIFWRFIKTHRKDYKYFKQSHDIDFIYGLADQFCAQMLAEYDIKIDVTYDDMSFKNQQVLFVSNHQSMFDSLFLFQELNHPVGFFIAGEFDRLLKIGIIKEIISASQSVYIYRNDLKKTAYEIKKASDYVKTTNYSYMIFPEGKIKCESDTFNGKTGEFLPGAFKIAKNNKLPIVPISICDSEKIHHTTNYFDRLEPGIVHIHFNQPIMPEEFCDKTTREIAQMARERIEKGL